MKRPELLIPAGDLETLKIAVIYGADAVYVGGEAFSLRAKAANFSLDDLREGIAFAHAHQVRVYVAANIYAGNEELEGLRQYFEQLREIRPDALIISDLGVFGLAREILPETEIHVSTQWNNTNYETFRFWYRLGSRKVVAARELSLDEIREIRAHIPEDMQIEAFVHGAMCISYSGKCQLSNYFTGRDSNHGECTHPCRWKYQLYEWEEDTGDYIPACEEPAHLMNSKDLCMVEHIPDLIEAGIDSFKIEGRMKSALYIATVARTYRKAIDACMQSRECYDSHMEYYRKEIRKGTFRDYCTGFFYGKPGEDSQSYENNVYIKNYTYLGYVERVENGMYVITQRNKFYVGDQIEVMKPDGRNLAVTVEGIFDEDGQSMESAPHPKQTLYLKLDGVLETYDMLRIPCEG